MDLVKQLNELEKTVRGLESIIANLQERIEQLEAKV